MLTSTLALVLVSGSATAGQPLGFALQDAADKFVSDFVSSRSIRGAAVTVWNQQGKVVWSKGYGTSGSGPFTPDTLCRVASVSKAFTSVVASYAAKERKLDLDKPVNAYLGYGKLDDPRKEKITARMLLQHVAGMESKSVFIVRPSEVSEKLPLTSDAITEWAMRRSALEREPGTGYAYSNTGFAVLTTVIEKATGAKYEAYARKVVGRMGLTASRIGNTLETAPGETKYYDTTVRTNPASFQYGSSVPPKAMTFPYGGAFVLENMPAGGGWMSTSNELAKLMVGTFGPNSIFDRGAVDQMLARPTCVSGTFYTGLGWNRSPGATWRTGSFECSSACVIWLASGYGFSYVQNTCTNNDKSGSGADKFLEQFTAWIERNAG